MNKYFLQPGYVYVNTEPTVITTILGSCVAVALHDRKLKSGGLNHYLLPKHDNHYSSTKFGDVATITLIKTMIELGSRISDIDAYIFGGAHLSASRDSKKIGQGNVQIAEYILHRYQIPVKVKLIGSIEGRKLSFCTADGRYDLKNIPQTKMERI